MTPVQIIPESFQFYLAPQKALEQVVRQIGYPKIPADHQINQMIQDIIGQGESKIQINFTYKETRIMNWEGRSIVAEGICIESLRWTELLKHMDSPERVCCFVVTLGAEFDQWMKQLQQQSMFDAFVGDAFGSVYIDFAADQLSVELENQYAQMALECSRRLSPGYCDWRLDDGQKAIFQIVQTGHIGVTCLPTGLMVPLKTISAAIFTGKRVPWKTPCVFCNDRTCRHRREAQGKESKGTPVCLL
jgi:hypothetical protein